MHTSVAAACIATALILVPSAAATASNEVEVDAGEGSAVAACQLLILVRAVIILDLEDSLGLATRPSQDTDALVLVAEDATMPVHASCDVALERLRIVVPPGQAMRAASYVTGPPIAGSASGIARNAADVEASEASAVAICQHLLLIDSVIVAGGAHGLPTGSSDGPLLIPSAGGHASCRVEVGEVEIVEGFAP